jgi:tRNA threonylcarbamoyl adenosine modification protein YeaZ
MRVLALDTALDACSVGLTDGAGLVADEAVIGKGHAEYLVPQIERLMAKAGAEFSEISRIVVSIGPGSFTGIRAGLAAARGLALALKVPVIGITTLEAIAAEGRAAHPGTAVLATIDARRAEVYAQAFSVDGVALTEPAVMSVAGAAELGKTHDAVLAGSGAALIAEALGSGARQTGIGLPTIATYLALGRDRAAPLHPPGPLYIRAADAKIPENYALPRQSGHPAAGSEEARHV